MNSRDYLSQRVLAVLLTLVMLGSVGGMAFIGGAGAQATGGTFDSAINADTDISSDVNIDDSGEVRLVGPNSSYVSGELAVNTSDGSVDVNSAPNPGDFGGVAISSDRVKRLLDQSNTGDADALNDIANLRVNGSGDVGFANQNQSYPAIFIEYDPQSEFSQIAGSDGAVDGEHDFMLVAAAGDGNVSAYSVDNDNVGARTTTLVDEVGSFGAVFDDLVGTDTDELSNGNIDDFILAGGVGMDNVTSFQSAGYTAGTISDLRVTDEAGNERLLNNEKITLNPNGDTQYFSSLGGHPDSGIPSAVGKTAGDQDDLIVVDNGTYDQFETDDIEVTADDVTIRGYNDSSVSSRLDLTNYNNPLVDATNETKLFDEITITGNDVTLKNLHIENDSSDADIVNVSSGAENPTISHTIIEQDGNNTGINVTDAGDTETNLTEVAVLSDRENYVTDGDTGVALSNGEDLTATELLLTSHETQVAGNADINESALLSEFEGDSDTQSAVAVNNTGVVDDTIHGNVSAADAAATDGNTIQVSDGTYNHGANVTLNTSNVELNDTDDSPVLNNALVIGAGGDVTVNGFDLDGDHLDATSGNPDSLTVNDTEGIATADVDAVANVTFRDTSADDYSLGSSSEVDTVTLEGTDATNSYVINATGTVNTTDADDSGADYTIDTPSDVNLDSSSGDVYTIDTSSRVDLDGTTGTTLNIGATVRPTTVNITNGEGDFDINATGDVNSTGGSHSGYEVDTPSDVEINSSSGSGTVDIGSTVTPVAVDVTDGSADHYVIDASGNVTVDDVTADPTTAGDDGINVTTGNPADITVINSNVESVYDGSVGVNVTASGDTNESTTVSDNIVNGKQSDGIGIAVRGFEYGNSQSSTQINDNTVTNLSDGVGIEATSPSTSVTDDAVVNLSDNTLQGGSEFIGMDLTVETGAVGLDFTLSNNDILGTDTNGGSNSVGIRFVEAPDFSGGFIDVGGAGAKFNDNLITGHARLIEDSTSGGVVITRNDYDAILNESRTSNDFGTLVMGPDASEGNGVYDDTYKRASDAYDEFGLSYLPGGISAGLNLADAAYNQTGDDLDVELQLYNTSVDTSSVPLSGTSYSAPDSYNESAVNFPNATNVRLVGQDEDVTAETNFTVVDAGNETQNHEIRDLTIDSQSGDALQVNKNNSQVVFDNLDVNTTGTGLLVDADSEDVNVVEVYDSDFDVDEDGIILSGGNDGVNDADDRDGFVVHNTDIYGSGIGDRHTGLNLSEVEKPGKDTLDPSLNVTENDIGDFGTQVDVGDDLPSTVNATVFVNSSISSGVNGVTISDNEFKQAILVYDNASARANNSLAGGDKDLYGSVNAADEVADGDSDGDIIDIGGPDSTTQSAPAKYEHEGDVDNNNVNINTTNVTVDGPVAAPGSSELRTNEGETAIYDPINVTADNVTLEGFAVIADQGNPVLNGTAYGAEGPADPEDAVVGAQSSYNLTVQNLSITTTRNPVNDDMPVGIGANTTTATNTTLEVYATFVGNHSAANTTGSAVVAQDNVSLTVNNSEFLGGENGDLDLTPPPLSADTYAYGVLAANDTAAQVINNTDITNFDADGINTIADGLTVKNSNVNDNNLGVVFSGTGGIVTNTSVSNPAGQYVIDDTTVVNNSDGVELSEVGLDMDDSNVDENNGFGVDVTDGEDIEIDDGTIEDNDGFGVDVENAATGADLDDVDVNDNDGIGVDVEDAGEAFLTNVEVDDNAGIGVDVQDVNDVDITGSDGSVEDNTGDGITAGNDTTVDTVEIRNIVVTDNDGDDNVDIDADDDVIVSGTEITNANKGLTIDTPDNVTVNSVSNVSDHVNEGIDVNAANASINSNTVNNNSDGITTDLNNVSATTSEINRNEVKNNDNAIVVNNNTHVEITGNNLNQTETNYIDATGASGVNATLNFFNGSGSSASPHSADTSADVTSDVVYDPFLVEDKTSSSVGSIEQTKDFGHDVVADAGSFTTVGFPSAPMDDYDSVDTAFDSNMNEVYELAENQSTFTSASGEFDAFSAFVMEANDNHDAVAVITYENSPGGSLSEDYTYDVGLNFVPPAQAGNATETLLVGQRTDSVQTGAFSLPTNLYGSEDATQSRNSSIIDPATNFGATYAVGVGDTKVHPHAGYFVVINNEDSANQRLEQIAAVPGGLTVDEVDRQMNFTATNP